MERSTTMHIELAFNIAFTVFSVVFLVFVALKSYITRLKHRKAARLVNLRSLYEVAKGSYSFASDPKSNDFYILKCLDENIDSHDIDTIISSIDYCATQCGDFDNGNIEILRKYYDYLRAYVFVYARSSRERSEIIQKYGTINHIII